MNLDPLIRNWQEAGEYRKIIEALEGVAVRCRSSRQSLQLAEAYLHLAQEGQKLERARKAMEVLGQVAGPDRNSAEWLAARGEALSCLGQMEEARAALQKAKSLDPASGRVEQLLRALPSIGMQRGDLYSVEDSLERHVERYFGSDYIRATTGVAWAEKGIHEEAVCFLVEPDRKHLFRTAVTASLSQEPMAVPEELAESVPERVEVVVRLPTGMEPDHRNTWPIFVAVAVVRAVQKRGGWLASGMVLPLPEVHPPFAAILLAPMLAWSSRASVCHLACGGEVNLFECLYLTENEYRSCSSDERVRRLMRRVASLPVSARPDREERYQDLPDRESEEEVLRRVARWESAGNPEEVCRELRSWKQTAKSRPLLLKLARSAFQLGCRRKNALEPFVWCREALQPMAGAMQADPEWNFMMGVCRFRQKQYMAALPLLKRAQAWGHTGKEMDGMLQICLQEQRRQEIRARMYTEDEMNRVMDHVTGFFGRDTRTRYVVGTGVQEWALYLMVASASGNRPWNTVITIGLGSLLLPTGQGDLRERVELVITLPDVMEMNGWFTGGYGSVVGRMLARLTRQCWRKDRSIHPGDWFPLTEPAPEGVTCGGTMVAELPEELEEMRNLVLPSGKMVVFYRLMFLTPEELQAAADGEARRIAEYFTVVPPGLEMVRPGAVAEDGTEDTEDMEEEMEEDGGVPNG